MHTLFLFYVSMHWI